MRFRHKFISPVADNTPGRAQASDWNADHNYWLGHREISGNSDTVINNDHLSFINYKAPDAVEVAIPAPTGENFPLGWQTRLRNTGAAPVTLHGDTGASVNAQDSIVLDRGGTLDLYSAGLADYIGFLIPPPTPPLGFGGRLSLVDAIRLQFRPSGGNYIKHNGAVREIPLIGIVGLENTNVLENGVYRAALQPDTTYLVFVTDVDGVLTGNFQVAPNPGDLHRPSTMPGNEGTEILFVGGAPRNNFSLIGMCHTNALAQFEDNRSRRWVISWFDRRNIVGQNFFSQRMGSAPGWPLMEISSEIRVYFLSWAKELVFIALSGSAYHTNVTQGAAGLTNIGVDGQPIDGFAGHTMMGYFFRPVNCFGVLGGTTPLIEGMHYATLMGYTDPGVAGGVVWEGLPYNDSPHQVRTTLTTVTRG